MSQAIKRAAAATLASTLLATGLTAALSTPAHATSIPGGNGSCPITFHANNGIVGGSIYVTDNPCNRPFRAHIKCIVTSPATGHSSYWVTGNYIAGTGKSTGDCDWLDMPLVDNMQYQDTSLNWNEVTAGGDAQTIYA